jgi:hypothetical protein
MALIQISTPVPDELLTLVWDDGKVRAKGGEIAKGYWRDLQLDGLYGRYGHLVNTDNVSVVDLHSALINRVGKTNIKMDPIAREELKKGLKDRAPSDQIT